MASNNIGKTFEQEFKECVPPDYYLYRLKDDTSGFYGVSNPCDYILFRSPYLFLVELKTHKGKSIPIAKIRPNQIQGMEKATHYEGVYGGFLINFRELEETYYITVQDVIQFTQTEERKSIPVEWCRDHGVKIEQKKEKSEIQLRSGELVKEVLWKIRVVIVIVHQWRCVCLLDIVSTG